MHFNLIALPHLKPASSVDLWPLTSNSLLLRGGQSLLLVVLVSPPADFLAPHRSGRPFASAWEKKHLSDALLHGDGPLWKTTTAQWHFSTAQQRGMCVLKTKRGGWCGSDGLWWSCGCGCSFRTVPQQGWNYSACVCAHLPGPGDASPFSFPLREWKTEKLENWIK